MPLVARELNDPDMPPAIDDASRAEQWSGHERTFSAVAALRANKPNALAVAGQRIVSFAGQLVQQRDALINLASPDKVGRSNLDRMVAGLAPLGANGLPLQLARATEAGAALVESAGILAKDLSSLLSVTPTAMATTAVAQAASSTASYWRARAASFLPPGGFT